MSDDRPKIPGPDRQQHPGGERFMIELQAERSAVPAHVRVRRLLKASLRLYGLRCVSVVGLPEGAPEAPQADSAARGADR
jgi:hypothetical protein